jgi:Na+/H+ antiporter NhaA
MTFLFLVIGLEAKRELDLGQLRERRRITLPISAAIGGMALPILIYLVFNAGGSGANGWGAAMSTDTAIALGVVALAAPPGSTQLRIRLLTLAIFDDLVSLVVIATVYTENLSIVPLIVAVAIFGVLLALRYVPITWRGQLALITGVALWVAVYESGIDPIVTGLAVGLVTSAYPPARSDLERATELARLFREQPTPELAREAQLGVTSAISANERLQYRLHPWTSYLIVPLFALANTGIDVNSKLLGDALTSPITLGILFGYLVGKPLGVLGGAWLASRVSGIRPALSWPTVLGGGAVAGVGLTISILISSLAFDGQQLEEAKLGVLFAAVASTILAWIVFRVIARLPEEVQARQIARTAETLIDLSDEIDPDVDHVRGPDDAPVTLVEYGDYECPYCGQAEVAIRELLGEFGDDLRYVWRNLPLNDVHTHAQMAAEATEAADAQGKFWELHDILLDHQDELTPTDLARDAVDLGLDLDRFWDEIRRRKYSERIARDVASADASGVGGTPTFFINGRRHEGAYDVDTLTDAVRKARALARLRDRGAVTAQT